jgi:ankyrin repeat protein
VYLSQRITNNNTSASSRVILSELDEEQTLFIQVEKAVKRCIAHQHAKELVDVLNLVAEHRYDLTKYVTKKGHTLLIESVIKNRPKATALLIKHVKSVAGSSDITQEWEPIEWVNLPSRQQYSFNALHYAAFYGKMDIIRILLDDGGASPGYLNTDGMNVLHVAA